MHTHESKIIDEFLHIVVEMLTCRHYIKPRRYSRDSNRAVGVMARDLRPVFGKDFGWGFKSTATAGSGHAHGGCSGVRSRV